MIFLRVDWVFCVYFVNIFVFVHNNMKGQLNLNLDSGKKEKEKDCHFRKEVMVNYVPYSP